MPVPLIEVREVHKTFQDQPVLRGVSLEVHENEVVSVIGTSGCGKSTLLRIISGLESLDEGSVKLNDDNFTMVFQYSALFDSLTVFENVAFSLTESPDNEKHRPKLPEKEIEAIVMEKLHLVGLDGIAQKYPNELSGGMQKRVSFARAIVSNPRIILYDEPTAGLDPIASTVIEDYMLKLKHEIKAASIVVTHQHSTIQRTSDRVCLLHQGKIRWMGTPQELLSTDNPYARQFTDASLEGPLTAGVV